MKTQIVEIVQQGIVDNSVYRTDEDYDFLDSVVYDGDLLDVLELIVREFAKTGYCREYFMDRVKSIADDEKLFKKRSIENLFKDLDNI